MMSGATSTATPFSVSVSDSVLFTSRPEFASTSFDFWLSTDPYFGKKWQNNSALTIDLNNKALQYSAAALSPMMFRLGGSPEDAVVFDTGDCQVKKPFQGYKCSQVTDGGGTYGCLTPERWTELLTFAHNANLKLIMGLNACYGRNSSTSPMDISNAQALMEYTVQHVDPKVASALYGFELGNEINRMVDAATWGRDVGRISQLARSVWASSPNPAPVVVAPDIGVGPTSYFSTLIKAANLDPTAETKNMTATTYHQYVNCPVNSTNQVLLLSCLQGLQKAAAGLVPTAKANNIETWFGEGAEHVDGGVLGITNTFVSSFFTAYRLGSLGAAGVSVSIRQDLCGGDYSLMNCTTWKPNPDYWVTLSFKRLVGTDAVGVKLSADDTSLQAFAHSATGTADGYVVTLINLSLTDTFSVSMSWPKSASTMDAWHFTGDLGGQSVQVNGQELSYDGGPMPGFPDPKSSSTSSPVTVAPASIVFVRIE